MTATPQKRSKRPALEEVATSSAPVNRLTRTRLRTRQKLVDAAQVVMSRKGVEAATIADITEEADVGFGSFYNHFQTKTEIATEVFTLRSMAIADELTGIFERVEDPVLAASFVQRWFVERGQRDQVWGWFIIHADAALPVVETIFRERIRRDLKRSIDVGRFNIPSLETVITITLASILSTMRRQLEGKERAESSVQMVEALMRMYGLPHREARAVARAPLPAWLRESFVKPRTVSPE